MGDRLDNHDVDLEFMFYNKEMESEQILCLESCNATIEMWLTKISFMSKVNILTVDRVAEGISS